ncbi:MAG TPA: hypothetical protein VFD84_02385 [Candidatus Binatia bacterium]|nr:hypothetical protein [Candidatus Binatia bacterium]
MHRRLASFAVALALLPRPGLAQALGTVFYGRAPASGQTEGTIWMADGDGGNDTQVTSGQRPRLSPDGSAIVFLLGGGFASSRGNIVRRDLAAMTEETIFTNGDFVVNFDWTADSAKVVFDFQCGIFAMNEDGTNGAAAVQGTDCFDDVPAVRASDGAIAFHNIHAGLLLADPDGTNRHLIPNTSAGDQVAAWSPDGAWLSFARDANLDGVVEQYFKIRPDGTDRTQLTFLCNDQGEVAAWGRAWTPDGTTLVIPATIGGIQTLYGVATDGSGIVRRIQASAGPAIDWVGSVTGPVSGDEVATGCTTTTTTTTTTSSTTTSSTTSTTTTSSTSTTTSSTSTTTQTTTTLQATTTTTTLAGGETCGNCLDDDGDGLTDFEDPRCCAGGEATMSLRHARLTPRRDGTFLMLDATIPPPLPSDLRAADVFVALRTPNDRTPLLCARIPASALRAAKKVVSFRDRRQAADDADGLEGLALRPLRDQRLFVHLQSRELDFATPQSGPLLLTVAFRNPATAEAGNRCARLTQAVRAVGRKKSLVFP